MLQRAPQPPAATDGWTGPRELPGYRAGQVVARLADLPEVYPDHLYFSLLLLDADGLPQDDHSGPCFAIARGQSLDARSRFVRVVAELVRHAPSQDRGLSAIGQALSHIRRVGIENEHLVLAAQLLDDVATEDAVVCSLVDLLTRSPGADEALRVMREVVAGLGQRARPVRGQGLHRPDPEQPPIRPDADDLRSQVALIVRAVGKSHARRYLREVMHFALVPTPDLLAL